MANNCLVTKLKSVVNNDNLKVLGALDLKVKYNSTLNFDIFTFGTKSSTVKILGDTDVVFTATGSKQATWAPGFTTKMSGGTTGEIVHLRIENKYNLNNISLSTEETNHIEIVDIDLEDLIACTNFNSLSIQHASPVSVGSIDEIVLAHDMATLVLQKGSIAIDSLLPSKNRLSVLQLGSSQSTGDISKLREFTLLTSQDWQTTISSTYMYGDVSTIPNHVRSLVLPGWRNNPNLASYSGFTWTAGTRTGSGINILVLNSYSHNSDFATSTDVDNYFIDNAGCDFGGGSYNSINIFVNGTYTPSAAATTAIATIKSKGITSVKVNNISL